MFSDFRSAKKLKYLFPSQKKAFPKAFDGFVAACLSVFLCFSNASEAQVQKENSRHNAQKSAVTAKQETLIYGESEASKAARDMANELADIEERSGQLRSRILRFQDLLASRFQDRIEAQFLVRVIEPTVGTDNNASLQPGDPKVTQGELPIAVVEMGASLNGIQIIQSDVPQILASSGPVPLFWGPLPVGVYEFKVNVTAGLLMHKLPLGLAQGRWLLEKQSQIKIPFGEKRKLLVEILVRPKSGVPDLQIRWSFVAPERLSRREEKP